MAGVCKEKCLGYNHGDEPLTLVKCYICGGLSVAKPITKGIEEIFLSFLLFVFLLLFYYPSFLSMMHADLGWEDVVMSIK